jgi:hypothetical protein
MAENTIIRTEQDGSISFGDYKLQEKTKVSDYEVNGDLYKVKTFYEITKLEKNGLFVYESVPGTAVEGFKETACGVNFVVSGQENAQITLGLCEESEYELTVDGVIIGKMKTNISGKLSISADLSEGKAVEVSAVKC